MILASKSPRRKEILESFGFEIEIITEDIVEESSQTDSLLWAQDIALKKGRAVATMYKFGRGLKVKCTEPSMIMALGSITPRVDYSQGNKWWTRLESMDDFHKPTLDAIGFQELITEEAAAWNTELTESFLEAQTPNREHYTLTLNPTDFSDYSGGSS